MEKNKIRINDFTVWSGYFNRFSLMVYNRYILNKDTYTYIATGSLNIPSHYIRLLNFLLDNERIDYRKGFIFRINKDRKEIIKIEIAIPIPSWKRIR